MHTFTAPGTYTASFSYISLEGCSALTQSTSLIEVLDQPKPDFTMPREVYISNPEIQTVNKTLNLGDILILGLYLMVQQETQLTYFIYQIK